MVRLREKSPKPPFCLGISVFNRSLLLRLALGCQLPVSFTPIFLGCISHRIRQATTDLHTINAKQSAQLGVSRAILVRILKVLVVSVVLALFLSLIGFFGGLGYHVNRIEEKSFVRTQEGFANATFICDLVYNPLLYPLYWLVGNGHPSGTFGMLVIPEGYPVIVDPFHPEERGLGRAFYGPYPRDRYPEYLIAMSSWGTLPNFLILLFIMMAVEIFRARGIYLILLAGILGFYAMALVGAVAGVLVASVILLLLWKFVPDFINQLVDFLFERQPSTLESD